MKKKLGIILIAVGLVTFWTSLYIDKEVSLGKLRIAKGEKQVDAIEKVSLVSPGTAVAGRVATSSGRKQIAEGREGVAWYENFSGWLKAGSGILLLVGFGNLVLAKKEEDQV